jgi:hypothetical protein
MSWRRGDDPERTVERHVRSFFAGHQVARREFERGPVRERVPTFAVLCVGPGPRVPLWTYITVGCWRAVTDGEHGLEFVVSGETDDERFLELAAMTAYYHAGPSSQRLDIGHTVPIGEPWLPGSSADHLLVSLPYPYGPDLELCNWKSGHARLLWLVPITRAERDFKAEEGLGALESRLEEAGALFHDPARPSVV